MRAFISMILTGVMLIAVTSHGAGARPAFAQGRTRTTSGAAQTSRVNSSSSVPVCKISGLAMPGADVGAKINACDAALGTDGSKAEIHVDTSGTISTYVQISRGRTLWFRKGTYTLHQAFTGVAAQDMQTELGMIRFRDDATIKGDGWESVIVEPPLTHRPTVIAPYISSVLTGGSHFHGVTRNVTIRDLQIRGQQKAPSNGVYSTIELGNSHNVLIENVFLNQTTGNGITAGGSAQLSSMNGCGGGRVERECASGVVMRGNRLFQVQNQGLNVINGRDVAIVNNVIKDHNRLAGSNGTGIDIESNTVSDTIKSIRIEGNMLDWTNSPQPYAGNGINVQSSGQADYGPVEVRNNTLIGNALTPTSMGHMVFGIFVSGGTRHVTVAGNKIQRTANSGIIVYGTGHTIEDNELVSVSGGGNLALTLHGTTNSTIRRNKVRLDPAAPGGSDVIAEVAASGANNNVLDGNIADTPPTIIGAASKIASHKSWANAAVRR